MQDRTNTTTIKVSNWGSALESARFRNKLIAGILLFTFILMLFPSFFAMIESRTGGIVLNDWLLYAMEPYDLSIPIFIVIWSMTILTIVRCATQPAIFLNVIYSLILVCITRMLTIYLVPLHPPEGLIAIKDPLTSITYGGKDVFITKDLFFSGHTSNLVMIGLCFKKKIDRWLAFTAAIAVGTMVLFQHVHYTIDVIGAFIITYLLVKLGKMLATY